MIDVLSDGVIIHKLVSSGARRSWWWSYTREGDSKANAFLFTANRQRARSLIGSAKLDLPRVIYAFLT